MLKYTSSTNKKKNLLYSFKNQIKIAYMQHLIYKYLTYTKLFLFLIDIVKCY